MPTDDRIDVIFAPAAAAVVPDALLTDVPPPPGFAGAVARFAAGAGMAHSIGCGCCGGRAPAAVALAGLFTARARGDVAFFTRVIADVRDAALVQRALEDDIVVRARFKLVRARFKNGALCAEGGARTLR